MHDLSLTLEFQIENKKKCLLKKIQTIAKVNISNIKDSVSLYHHSHSSMVADIGTTHNSRV